MAKLPPIRRLLMQDFTSQSAWIGPLLQNVNNFAESVYNTLNQSLSITDNTTGALLPVVLTQLPSSTSPVQVPWRKPGIPQAVIIGNVQKRTVTPGNALATSGSVITAGVSLEWQYVTSDSGNYVQITNVVGIPTPTTKVTITLMLAVFTG